MCEKQKRRKLSKDEREVVYQKMDGHCAYCGCELKYDEMQIDHIIPLRKGGADTLENMLPACRSCNHYKSTLDLEDFRTMIERMPETLMRDSVTYKNAVRFGVVIPNKTPVVFYYEKHPDTWEREKVNKDNKLEIVKSRDEDYFYIKIDGRIDWYDSMVILDPIMPNRGNYFLTKEDAETAKTKLLVNLDTINQGVHNYFYIDVKGKIYWHPSDIETAYDLALFNMSNYFWTEEAAKAARPEMLKKFDAIKMDALNYLYIYIGADENIYWGLFDKNHVFDLAMINMGNYFSTEEEAEAAKPEMLKKFDAIRQGMKK